MQTREEIEAIANEFEKYAGTLLSTDNNAQKLLGWIAENAGGRITLNNLLNGANALRDQLEWFTSPTGPATVAPKPKGTLAERLYLVGVQKSPHLSQAEKQELAEESDDQFKASQERTKSIRDRIERAKAIAEAEQIVVQGPGGRINWAATERARRKALTKLNAA